MIIYLETRAKHYPQTLRILEQFKSATVIDIAHYKNVFDKNTAGLNEQKSMIIAKLESPAITEAPAGYGHTSQAYFFKTSLNCIYDCSYCFLKGAFKTEHMVFFVNYDDIKEQISEKISELKNS
jgi:spore photoproduct lyase